MVFLEGLSLDFLDVQEIRQANCHKDRGLSPQANILLRQISLHHSRRGPSRWKEAIFLQPQPVSKLPHKLWLLATPSSVVLGNRLQRQ